jgi:heme exporter protein D
MSFASWADFWAMGGYAGYVWPSVGICGVVMIYQAIAPSIRYRHILRTLRRRSDAL